MSENPEKLAEIRQNFATKFFKLKNSKDILLGLFKKKLEEKKIEDIKRSILNINHE